MGQKISKSKVFNPLLPSIPRGEEERLTVDSSCLCCPICYTLYHKSPVVLPCGHSFCSPCIKRLTDGLRPVIANQRALECPFCRKPAFLPARIIDLPVNYALEMVLDSVGEIIKDDERAADRNLKFENNRLKKQIEEKEQRCNRLSRESEQLNSDLQNWRLLALTLLVVVGVQCLRKLAASIF